MQRSALTELYGIEERNAFCEKLNVTQGNNVIMNSRLTDYFPDVSNDRVANIDSEGAKNAPENMD